MLDDLNALMEKYGVDALLTAGSPFKLNDLFWLTGFRSGDEIVFIQNINDKPIVAAAFHTLSRVQKETRIKTTHDLTGVYLRLMRENKRVAENLDVIFDDILRSVFTGKTIGIPEDASAKVFETVQKLGYDVKVVSDFMMDARATKSESEINAIKSAGDATTGSISEVLEIVKDSEVGPKKTLMYEGKPLTVKDVKLTLEHFLLDQGTHSSEDTILAVGDKGFDWHYLGAPGDELKAEVPIILDVFPMLKMERYVADVTRTFIKGSVSEKIRHMFESVKAAADSSVDALTDGAKIDDVNLACAETLKGAGYDSRRLNPAATEGMTHGLGHGIGLAVHEGPSMSQREDYFKIGNVMAIEPGVYLKEIGGVRIENDYAVTKGKAKLLTTGLDELLYL
ncbi:MAG: aminopeptidase P family protein [Candidatus Thorarchaeota archaeon]|nr:MAG: aminopeptidase P family protein [Candidatus Thorarchaeota archaeon]